MIEHVGRLRGQRLAVARDRGDRRLDRLLAELFRGAADAVAGELRRVGRRVVRTRRARR